MHPCVGFKVIAQFVHCRYTIYKIMEVHYVVNIWFYTTRANLHIPVVRKS